MRAGSWPEARFSAMQTSCSRLEPGKIITAAFIGPLASARLRRCGYSADIRCARTGFKAGSGNRAGGLVFGLNGRRIGRVEWDALAGIAGDDIDPGRDRRLVRVIAGANRAAGHNLAALREQQAELLQAAAGAADNIDRRRETEAASGDGGADQFAGVGPDRVRATE